MGGKDLNQKKSWHPNTLKNQEKVWKATQSKNSEDKKFQELQKELENERNQEELKRMAEANGVLETSDKDKKLEWMYKNSVELINREEYLLGRTIDKSFEILQEEEQKNEQNIVGMKLPINHVEHECVPFSIRDYRNVESKDQVDLQRKIMEDPLMLIKQREIDQRRMILENPVKLKELHRKLESIRQTTDKKKTKLKKSKKTKKTKKSKKSKKKSKRKLSDSSSTSSSSPSSRSSSSSSSESETDLDAKLMKEFNKLRKKMNGNGKSGQSIDIMQLLEASQYEQLNDRKKFKKSKKKHSKKKSSDISSDDEAEYKNSKSLNRNRDRSSDYNKSRNYRNSTSDNRSFKMNDKDRNEPLRNSRSRKRHSNNETNDYEQGSNVRHRDDEKINKKSVSKSPRRDRKVYRRNDFQHHSKNNRSRSRSRSRSPPKTKAIPRQTETGSRNSKLSEEEKEARRREMMDNASWRETERSNVVKKHREEYAQEEKLNTERDFDKNFINKQVQKAIANQTSVGSRIRSNLNNIQRSAGAMDRNFARK